MKKIVCICLTVIMTFSLCYISDDTTKIQAANTTKTQNGWVLKRLKKDVPYTGIYAKYTGKAKKITVPSGVVGLIDLPDTVQEVRVPASVKTILVDYAKMKNMRKYTISPKNKTFSAKDGVLFNKKDAELLHYPPKKKNRSYTVPKGTKTIALLENHNLKTLKLPDSLKWIGGICSRKITKLHIPKNVSNNEIKINIPGEITVAKGNKHLILSDGVMFNKKKTKLIHYPQSKANDSFTIPSGVKEIAPNAFEYNKHLKTLHISKNFNWKGDVDFIAPFFNFCAPYLERITVDEDNPDFTAEGGVLYNKNMTILYAYPGGKRDKSYIMPNTIGNENDIEGYVAHGILLYNNRYLRDITLGAAALVGNENEYEQFGRIDWWWMYTSFPINTKNVYVDEANPMFSSIDGVLFNKDKSHLIYYPTGRTDGVYSIPKSVTHIRGFAFSKVKKKLTVKLPDNVESITESEILWEMDDIPYSQGLKQLQESYKNITFKVKKGSVSHKTVKNLGLKYKFY